MPILKPGEIVVTDNLGSHKSTAVRRMTRAAGARLWCLPPYSPNINPIERAFAKIKHWMRQAQKRTIEDAWRHISWLIGAIEPRECANYPRNAGYASVKKRKALLGRASGGSRLLTRTPFWHGLDIEPAGARAVKARLIPGIVCSRKMV